MKEIYFGNVGIKILPADQNNGPNVMVTIFIYNHDTPTDWMLATMPIRLKLYFIMGVQYQHERLLITVRE